MVLNSPVGPTALYHSPTVIYSTNDAFTRPTTDVLVICVGYKRSDRRYIRLNALLFFAEFMNKIFTYANSVSYLTDC